MSKEITRKQYDKALDIVEQYRMQLLGGQSMPSWRDFIGRRKRLNLSMQDVTNCTGICKATISRLERGSEVYYGTVKQLNDFYLSNEV